MTKAKMPETVQIGAVSYTVRCDETAGLKAKVAEQSATCVGNCDYAQQLIQVDSSQGPDQLADTLLHEVIHAIWAHVGLHESPGAKQEERIVASLAPSLLDTLRRNPALVSYLVAP